MDATGNVTPRARPRSHPDGNAPRRAPGDGGLGQNTVGLLRFVAHVLAILMLAACGSSSTGSRPSPSNAASPSRTASPSAAASPSPTPVVGTYAVLATAATSDTYTVSLIGTDGSVVSSATASSPTSVTCGDASAADVPLPVSTSDTRAYFLDAQGNVRFLTPNGETGSAT